MSMNFNIHVMAEIFGSLMALKLVRVLAVFESKISSSCTVMCACTLTVYVFLCVMSRNFHIEYQHIIVLKVTVSFRTIF